MDAWPVQDAKARFSELLDACLERGPQLVTRRGTEAAVLVPIAQWKQMKASSKPDLKQLLLGTECFEIPIPARGRLSRRRPPEF
ncbi:prevent-host-death protein [bacterium SCN 62-11]|nr:type II toxin-antitoxin system Phd/YefM family antitoxin [Candidatus Eremiobacteraeota bacterium]ODT65957.1 MAG: prevent-host-death protein [bacterium SCN 62-11]